MSLVDSIRFSGFRLVWTLRWREGFELEEQLALWLMQSHAGTKRPQEPLALDRGLYCPNVQQVRDDNASTAPMSKGTVHIYRP